MIVFGNQHHGDSHHDFIGNRVEEGAKTGALIPATSEETIKPVGYRGNKEDQRAGKRRPAKGQIKRQHKNGIRMTRNRVSNVGILNCIVTGNYLL